MIDILWSKDALEFTVISPPVPINENQSPLLPIVQDVVLVAVEPADETVTGSAPHSNTIASSQLSLSGGQIAGESIDPSTPHASSSAPVADTFTFVPTVNGPNRCEPSAETFTAAPLLADTS